MDMENGRGWDLLPPGRQEQESSKLTERKELDREGLVSGGRCRREP